MKFDWEALGDGSARVKVHGGWVLRYRDTDDCNTEFTVATMVFVPDPFHRWEIT